MSLDSAAARATATYGSDQTGLIRGFVFGAPGSGSPIDSERALEWIARPAQDKGSGFLWLHFNLANVATENWIKQHLSVPDVFVEALHAGSLSTRVEYADGVLVAVVNDVRYDFSLEPSEISTLWLCVSPHALISVRRQPLRSIDRLRAAVNDGEHFGSSVDLLAHLLHDQADVLVQIVRNVTARIDAIEDRVLAERMDRRGGELGPMRRVLVRLQRLLAPEPTALFRLLNRPPAWIGEKDLQELRQSSEEFSVALSDMSALQERIKLLQEDVAARINEQNNRSLFVLTVVTVLALPINIIAGLFGMNVGGVPLAQHNDGFWIVVGIVATFTVIAAHFAFRKRRD